MKTTLPVVGERVSRLLILEALTALSAGFGPPASVLAAFVALGVAITPSTAYAGCGDHNEKACCACDNSSTCKSGLFEICGCDTCVGCNTGSCAGGSFCFGVGQSNGFCVDLHPCGMMSGFSKYETHRS